MARQMAERPESSAGERIAIFDTDIHNLMASGKVLRSYLPERWQRHYDLVGARGPHGYMYGSTKYPKVSAAISRVDSWPPTGGMPGSDLAFMREQHLDAAPVEYGILNTLEHVAHELNTEWAAALARAINDWQMAEWLGQDDRLRASILVAQQDADLAVEEIERVGRHPGFVQVMLLARVTEPLGRRRFWKIYEAAERLGLVIGMHASNAGGVPSTPSGWPSYYLEDHAVISSASQSQIASLVLEGVFERHPGLKFVCIEGGFAWLAPLMWRLDKHWKRLREEVPHLQRKPSEYILDHVWVTTQPIEEPADPRHLLQAIEHIGQDDRVLFATDYPHWDYDDPQRALPEGMPPELRRKILSENAKRLYGLD